MPKENGLATIFGDGFKREMKTHSCAHCQFLVHVPSDGKIETVGDFCRQCMAVICMRCADARVCTPFLKQLEQAENRYHARRQFEIIAGL